MEVVRRFLFPNTRIIGYEENSLPIIHVLVHILFFQLVPALAEKESIR